MNALLQAIGVAMLFGHSMAFQPADTNAVKKKESTIAIVKMNCPHAEMVESRTVPFLATPNPIVGPENPIHVNAQADTLILLGMMNHHWDIALAHWGEQPELWEDRIDQIHLGVTIGKVEVHYTDGAIDVIPLTIGATAFFVARWASSEGAYGLEKVREPFASRPELMAVLRSSLQLREHTELVNAETAHQYFYLPVKPREKIIDRLVVLNNEEVRGTPLVSGVTLIGVESGSKYTITVEDASPDPEDLIPAFDLHDIPDFSGRIAELAAVLYTTRADLPKSVEPIDFPSGVSAARVTFHHEADREDFDLSGMLNNMWVANLVNIHDKFCPEVGSYIESAENMPWYGGYGGFGTWEELGIYGASAGRSSDHFAAIGMRALHNRERLTNYVDHVDKWLRFYRSNHDPEQGPPNDDLDIDRYPEGAPSHWAFVIELPLIKAWPMNEIHGTEEMDGHASVMIGRWWAWRLLGGPTDEWLMEPRAHRYGNSRYDDTVEGAEFICWLLDYTGRNVVYSEGESTAWGGGPSGHPGSDVPAGWPQETDPDVIHSYYQQGDVFYQTYPNFACYVALKLSATMADAVDDKENAGRWRAYADRIYNGMLDELTIGSPGEEVWRVADHSIFPSYNEALVQAFFSTYMEGYDPANWDQRFREITHRTFLDRLSRPNSGRAVIGMGYGQGWMLHSALAFDEMDHASVLMRDLAIYSYDKNMNYHDPERGIDWRDWQWIIPEGTNVIPDGSWYRISDLGNGANQGPAMNAILYSVGVDDSDPDRTKIMPRILEPMDRLDVADLQTVVGDGNGGMDVAMVSYEFHRGERFLMRSDRKIPNLSVRLGPFTSREKADPENFMGIPKGVKLRTVEAGRYNDKSASWLWIEDMENVKSLDINLNPNALDP